jgi:hypothetical protein
MSLTVFATFDLRCSVAPRKMENRGGEVKERLENLPLSA